MAYPEHLLARGETVVLHKHPHWKVLILPVLWLVLIIGGGSFGFAYSRAQTGNYGIWWIVIGAVGTLGIICLSVAPFIRWRTEHFVITNRHVFFRTGFFRRREHQIPLGRIQNLETSVTFWGRILGFGTLIVESAADQPLSFSNVASLPRVQGELNQLIDDDRTGSAGYFRTGDPDQQDDLDAHRDDFRDDQANERGTTTSTPPRDAGRGRYRDRP